MNNTIRARTKKVADGTKVSILFKHPMETGLRKDKKTGKKIPAHFIKEVKCYHNGDLVLEADWGVAISKNPYLSFVLEKAKPGDKINISWLDNKGDSNKKEILVK
jgi:sulfur-oxidizing protein SoxZ